MPSVVVTTVFKEVLDFIMEEGSDVKASSKKKKNSKEREEGSPEDVEMEEKSTVKVVTCLRGVEERNSVILFLGICEGGPREHRRHQDSIKEKEKEEETCRDRQQPR